MHILYVLWCYILQLCTIACMADFFFSFFFFAFITQAPVIMRELLTVKGVKPLIIMSCVSRMIKFRGFMVDMNTSGVHWPLQWTRSVYRFWTVYIIEHWHCLPVFRHVSRIKHFCVVIASASLYVICFKMNNIMTQ